MATAQEIEDVLGVSKRTIETWLSNGNGAKNSLMTKRLALFLKSFSKRELQETMRYLKEEHGDLPCLTNIE